MIQTNSAAAVFEKAFGTPPFITGTIIAALTGTVLFCGAKAVLKTSSLLVPAMAIIYIFGCFAALFIFRENIIPAFKSIFESAFEPISIGGGIFGIITSKSLRAGISKGTFTHEAGMGSASLAHSESGKNPLTQGCWGIIEVFIDTIFVCSLTAMVILSAKADLEKNESEYTTETEKETELKEHYPRNNLPKYSQKSMLSRGCSC